MVNSSRKSKKIDYSKLPPKIRKKFKKEKIIDFSRILKKEKYTCKDCGKLSFIKCTKCDKYICPRCRTNSVSIYGIIKIPAGMCNECKEKFSIELGLKLVTEDIPKIYENAILKLKEFFK